MKNSVKKSRTAAANDCTGTVFCNTMKASLVYHGLLPNARETLMKSAAADGERFFVKARFEKRRNTLCISRFSNRRIGGKDPSSVVGGFIRGSQVWGR